MLNTFENVHLKCTPGSLLLRFLNTPLILMPHTGYKLLVQNIQRDVLSNEESLHDEDSQYQYFDDDVSDRCSADVPQHRGTRYRRRICIHHQRDPQCDVGLFLFASCRCVRKSRVFR